MPTICNLVPETYRYRQATTTVFTVLQALQTQDILLSDGSDVDRKVDRYAVSTV